MVWILVVLGVLVVATLVSALAWSTLGLVAFVPLIGLAVVPLQVVAQVVRGLVFEYVGLTAMGAYITLYARHRAPGADGIPTVSAAASGLSRLSLPARRF
mgnify:CR=1 FL=1